jgi:competence protein ComGC
MRKLLFLVVVLSLGTFASARTMGSDSSDMQSTGNDWYNQNLSAQVQQFELIKAATAPSMTQAENQSGALPGSMAANAGSQGAGSDWYNQVIAAQAQEFARTAAAKAPAK